MFFKMATKLIENVDEDVWNKTAGIAKMRNMKMGELVTEILNVFVEKQKIIKEKKNE